MKYAGHLLVCIFATLTGCASFAPEAGDFAAQKMRLMQSVLDKTPDGSVGYWKLDEKNFGLVTVDSTLRKSTTVCRLVHEDEVKSGRSTSLVASYCKEPKGAWQ